ncbi:MAG: ribbon-helix-helix protein, CopG family, partial [Verrucomicrobiae bacterium]|nr:ribbon-helix-helix protein, CopG family [Verrucomicrobiae bacterium]
FGCYTSAVPLGSQLPIRLDLETDRRLMKAAKDLQTSKSALIRLLAKTFCDQVIQPDGSVLMPPNWRELLPRADGRSKGPTIAAAEKIAGKLVDGALAEDLQRQKKARRKKRAKE